MLSLKKNIEELLSRWRKKYELDIVAQLFLNYEFKKDLESFLKKENDVLKASYSVAYIDKRPIVKFDYPEYKKDIELADLFFLIDTLSLPPNKPHQQSCKINYNSVFIQAKKRKDHETEKKITAKNERERKQFYLFEKWPVFSLNKPQNIGNFLKGSDFTFEPKSSEEPGAFMSVSDNKAPYFFKPHKPCSAISTEDYFRELVNKKTGRPYREENQYSEFVQELYKDSKKSTFRNKRIYKYPTSRVLSYLNSYTKCLKVYSTKRKFIESVCFNDKNNRLLEYKLFFKEIKNRILRQRGFLVVKLTIIREDND